MAADDRPATRTAATEAHETFAPYDDEPAGVPDDAMAQLRRIARPG